MSNILLENDLARWYDLKPHPVQDALVNDDVRFKVVPAGRRSGKTERAKRYMARESLQHSNNLYFLAAPTHAQCKKIWWDDMKKLTLSSTHPKRPSEGELKIFLPNGSEIHLIGLDKPARIEGIAWGGGIIDEVADIKAGAWEYHILPALNTYNPTKPDYKPWCWNIGVPDGLNHYYDMAEYARTSNDPEWKLYHWKSADILPLDVIESAKRQMSPLQFKQEFEASFETASGRIYADYGDDNITTTELQSHEQIHWTHDQNYTPMSSAICVVRDDKVYIVDEIVLSSAVSRQSAEEFVEKYKNHDNKHVLLYGDPAGKAGEKHGHPSDYTEIENVLRSNGWKYTRKVKKKHPAIKDRQNAVRAMIQNAAGEVSLYINPNLAPYCHKGLSTLQTKQGSTFQEAETEYQHITTAIGYFIDVRFPIITKTITTTKFTGF